MIEMRNECNGSRLDNLLTLEEALRDLHRNHLSFGGVVERIGTVALVVRTPKFGPNEVATYTGEQTDMRPLIRMAWAYRQLRRVAGDAFRLSVFLNDNLSLKKVVDDLTVDDGFTKSIASMLALESAAAPRPTSRADYRAQKIREAWSAGALFGAVAMSMATGMRDPARIRDLLGLTHADFYALHALAFENGVTADTMATHMGCLAT